MRSSDTDDQIQNDLFELLGDLGIDLLMTLLQHRQAIVDAHAKSRTEQHVDSGLSHQAHPSSNITVMTAEEKRAAKLRRKEERRSKRMGHAHTPLDGEVDLEALRRESISSVPLSMPGPGTTGSTAGGHGKMAFPEGTVRKVMTGREEVFIPAPTAKVSPLELVPISAFDDFAQLAFQGMKSLNRMQSQVYPSAYHSNENLLICAPTGAGKTNVTSPFFRPGPSAFPCVTNLSNDPPKVAMMTVLHEVGANFLGGVLQREQFKIVYVAPMKALAAEVTSTFSRRLQGLGVVVRELTGDMQLTKKEIQETQMIVTTPEKWDVITRKTSDMALTTAVKLLIFDEVHLLHDERGTVIETLVARTLRQVESTQSMIRIVGLSATLPNYADVAAFLRVNPETGLFYFDSSFRPVPLQQQYIGITEPNPMKRLTALNQVPKKFDGSPKQCN